MQQRRPQLLVKKAYFWFAVVIVFLTAAFLIWSVSGRMADHENYHQFIAMESAAGVADEVSRFVSERNRLVQVFAVQHVEAIRHVAKQPANQAYYQQLSRLIKEYFPGHFAFTVASSDGVPLFEDFDGLVAESCRVDIKSFTEKQYYHPYIHPNYEGYHFDVMTNYGDNEGVLFISFRADILGAILRAAQTSGHELILTYPALNDLIEVVSEGARNQIVRDDYRLSDEEKARILVNVPVNGTRWEAVDLSEPGLFSTYRFKLYSESIIIFCIFLVAAIVMVWRLRKEELQRETVEKQKQELMGVISHEFRTPAAAIHGALELLSRGTTGPLNSDSKHLVDMASSNTLRLLTLVNDFLDIQKYESGKLNFDKKVCQLGPILDRSVKNNKIYAEQFGVTYVLNNPLADLKTNCDPMRIEQVLSNLLSNAAKYGAVNDVIEILVSKPNPDMVRVSVVDHGDGIPEQIQGRVFEKFVMARSEKNGKVRSSGLGLSISKAIVEEHGGRIAFETRRREGTTFYFELPVVNS